MKSIRFLIIALSATSIFFISCNKATINPPPNIAVNAGPSKTIQLPSDSVTLTGTVTSGQSSNLIYSWTLILGPNRPVILDSNSRTATAIGLISGTYIFQFEATNNTSTVIGEDTVSVVVAASTTLTLQPSTNPYEGIICDYYPTTWIQTGQILAQAWTAGGAPFNSRSCILFDYSSIPSGAIIDSATLYLYSDPNPINGNLVDAQSGISNACYIERITSPWVLPNPFTWNNQPTTVATDEAVIPQSDSSNENAVVNVSALVRDMQTNGNNGFFIQLQNEVTYNTRQYVSSNGTNTALHPKLVITYH